MSAASRERSLKKRRSDDTEELVTEGEDSKLVVYESTADVLKKGFRPVILFLASLGMNEKEVAREVKRQYGVVISTQTAKKVMNFGGGAERALSLQDNQEQAHLRLLAIEQLNDFRERMLKYEEDGNRRSFELCAKEFREWWDRMGRIHFPQHTGGGVNVDVQVGDRQENNQVNQLIALIDKVKDDPGKYEATVGSARRQENAA